MSCFQSSSASARRVNASDPSRAKWSPRRATRQRTPRGKQLRSQPVAETGGIRENEPRLLRGHLQDCLRGRRCSGGRVVQDLRARRPIWPSPSGPSSPGNEAVSVKPVSRKTSSHWERSSNGWSGRKSRSVNRHQPLVRPNTASVHNCGLATSMNTRLPPGASSS